MSLDLFENEKNLQTQKDVVRENSEPQPSLNNRPLADRMRPQSLDTFFGQEHLVGKGQPFRKLIEADAITSFVLWGPPGTGKTTLARIVAHHTQKRFVSLSAVMSGVKDIKEEVQTAKYLSSSQGKATILFVDEIHRFNKSQQDALLPHVEDGTVTLIGATTENPSFELNSALLSRAPVFVLRSLDAQAVRGILNRALSDRANGLGGLSIAFPDPWLNRIVDLADGDARKALTYLERAAFYVANTKVAEYTDATLFELLGRKQIRYDATGEEHYNTVSAFIKSMRDSDPDAAVYYLARMIEGGEDPLFIARRMVIFAAEDVGNADPRALPLAIAVKEAVEFVGMPEGRIPLAHGVTYLAACPKSNASYIAIDEALSEVQASGALPVPFHLRNAVTGMMKSHGYGKGYQYAHDKEGASEGAMTNQKNLPREIEKKRFYRPKNVGLEKQIAEKLELKKKLQGD